MTNIWKNVAPHQQLSKCKMKSDPIICLSFLLRFKVKTKQKVIPGLVPWWWLALSMSSGVVVSSRHTVGVN